MVMKIPPVIVHSSVSSFLVYTAVKTVDVGVVVCILFFSSLIVRV